MLITNFHETVTIKYACDEIVQKILQYPNSAVREEKKRKKSRIKLAWNVAEQFIAIWCFNWFVLALFPNPLTHTLLSKIYPIRSIRIKRVIQTFFRIFINSSLLLMPGLYVLKRRYVIIRQFLPFHLHKAVTFI